MHTKKDKAVELELPFLLMQNPDRPKKTHSSLDLGFSGFELRYQNLQSTKFEVDLHSVELVYNPMVPRILRHYTGNHFYEAGIYEKRMRDLFKSEGDPNRPFVRNTKNAPDELYNSLKQERK